jgi:hypothetical protein
MLNILWHVKTTLPIMKEIFRRQNQRHFLPSFTLRPYFVSVGCRERSLVDESGMVRSRMGNTQYIR